MISIIKKKIDVEEVVRSVTASEVGAVDVFIGTTRNHSDGRKVKFLEYEAYEPMAMKMLEQLVGEASKRWELVGAAIVHRVGKVNVGDASVVIAVSSAHRREAFQACRFLIDRLKQVVPIWKREYFEDGTVEWSLQSHGQHAESEMDHV